MTIIEAIKSGKPFRRSAQTFLWYMITPWGRIMCEDDNRGDLPTQVILFAEDILAEDWIIKETK